MSAKSIASLIHDQIHAAGGTLNVWLNGAKFRKATTLIVARTMHSKTEEENLDGVADFEPSPELLATMKRNAGELRKYRDEVVRAWRIELWMPPVVGPSVDLGRPAPSGRGDGGCECNAVTRSPISPKAGVNSPEGRRVAAVMAVVVGGILAPAAGVDIGQGACEWNLHPSAQISQGEGEWLSDCYFPRQKVASVTVLGI